jgi:hypothetical protein
MKKSVLLKCLFTVAFLLFFLLPAHADWESDLNSHFDIVETFDNLQDWFGSDSDMGDISNPAAMPRKSDGAQSIFNYYSDWISGSNGSKWIGDFGAGTKITTIGKSLRMSVKGGDYGPSRMGGYFGDGKASSGYKNLYFFYRAYFPVGYFPSALIYEKLLNLGHGFTASLAWNGLSGFDCNNDGESCRMPYGISSFVPQAEWSGPEFRLRSADYYTGTYPYSDEKTGATIPQGKWVTFEYHMVLDDTGNDSDDIEIWMYDESGKAVLVHSDTLRLHSLAASFGHAWNWFFIGGNDDNGGSGTYYVDDIIINSSRIGPTYFQLLNGGVGTSPLVSPPGYLYPPK